MATKKRTYIKPSSSAASNRWSWRQRAASSHRYTPSSSGATLDKSIFVANPTAKKPRKGKATAPGQMKKAVGAKSAKPFAPGQRKKARLAPGPATWSGAIPYASKAAKPAVAPRGGTAGKLAPKPTAKGYARTRTRKK